MTHSGMIHARLARPATWALAAIALTLLSISPTRAADDAQTLLDKAAEVKLTAENLADLNQVITLCHDALEVREGGLDESNRKFASELLAGTLTQRAELVCMELFERPVTPSRARKLLQMALGDLQESVMINAEQPEAQYLLGRLYAHTGDDEKSLKALDMAISLSEHDPMAKSKALIIRANMKKDPAERQADYDAALALTPKDPNVLRFRGMHYLTQNNLDLAIADLSKAIELEPGDAETYEALGMGQAMAKKDDAAMESFNKAIELAPKSPGAYMHRARLRALKSDYPAAIADVEQVMKLQPGSLQALLLHANLLATTGKLDQALTELNLVRQVLPDNPEVLLQIAALYQVTKQTDKALSTYDHLLSKETKNVVALRGRADVYLGRGKQTEAIADYEEALKVDPKNSGILNNLAWVLATSPDDKLRDGKRAIELAKLACEVTEYKQAHILSTLAACYAETGDFDAAIDWSKKAVDLGTEQLKGQLGKELESYQAKKPWREDTPPQETADEQAAKEPEAAPDKTDTAKGDTAPGKSEN